MGADATPAIRVTGARKTYRTGVRTREFVAVRDVAFTVERGTIHGLLGPNGAGKTTTLKMLLGLVRPTAGTFEILGGDSTRPRGRAGVGFLPEQPYFPQHLTATQALRLYARLAGLPSADIPDRTAELLRRVGLEGRGRSTLESFSRGMLQRLGIAQALITNPPVVVLDEPASGLDPVGQRDIRNLMLELRSHGTAVLLSSHQLSEVEAVCDRVTILEGGRVAAEGHIDELLNVSGQVSIRARGFTDALPTSVSEHALDVAVTGGVWVFSVPDTKVRRVVEAIDDAGGVLVSLMPKRESLEDYFTRLLVEAAEVRSR